MGSDHRDLEILKNKGQRELEQAGSLKELQRVFKHYLGRNGQLTAILRSLGRVSAEEKKTRGKIANELKDMLERIFERRSEELLVQKEDTERIDVTAPGVRISQGHLHPLTLVQRKAYEIFQGMGFAVVQGPEVETEWYNFDALNIPANHPARDLWDTFWLKVPENTRYLLRTHTSPVQIRYMEAHNPPLRIIVPGRIFRYEATDSKHEINFYQLEGLMVAKRISVANFKAIIEEFYRQFFEKPVSIRLRPSYFPFTEPSFEVDMMMSKGTWLEMMGAGMVHPHVFKAAGSIPKVWQGFAFGMGLDRLAMMRYQIPDIRLLYSGDLRFLQQF